MRSTRYSCEGEGYEKIVEDTESGIHIGLDECTVSPFVQDEWYKKAAGGSSTHPGTKAPKALAPDHLTWSERGPRGLRCGAALY